MPSNKVLVVGHGVIPASVQAKIEGLKSKGVEVVIEDVDTFAIAAPIERLDPEKIELLTNMSDLQHLKDHRGKYRTHKHKYRR